MNMENYEFPVFQICYSSKKTSWSTILPNYNNKRQKYSAGNYRGMICLNYQFLESTGLNYSGIQGQGK